MNSRRQFFSRFGALGAGMAAGSSQTTKRKKATDDHSQHTSHAAPAAQTQDRQPVPFETPDLGKLAYQMVDGVKEFHLVAEVVKTELMPGRAMIGWGFNGSIPGPTIEATEGDRVRVVFENRLPEMSAVHWHGLEAPMEAEGSVGLGHDPILPGGKYVYEFDVHQHGTFFYHSHFAMQEMMGMLGFVIFHPKKAYEPAVDHDFGLILQEWALLPNNDVPNTLSMEFNWLTFNGKAGPDCTPMLVRQGERVRVRMVNLGMDHHPVHLHGNQFAVTGTEAGRCPRETWFDQNTVLVGVAQARDIEFVAKYTGDWMLHCHLPHHMMNQMMSMVGPLTHGGHGIPAGGGMAEGMGIVRQGHALSEDLGPALGRTLGLGASGERMASNTLGPNAEQQAHAGHGGASAEVFWPKDDPERKKIPGYPQDMWMPMDEIVRAKPENLGLRKNWSAAMMGMMTLVRVLKPEKYDEIMAIKGTQKPKEKKDEHVHKEP